MIDWTKPICLDTQPPRMALLCHIYDDASGARVYADWRGEGRVDWRATDNGGVAWLDLPRVRNLRPDELAPPAANDDDITAELAAILSEWQEIGALGPDDYDLRSRTAAALAKWESRK